MITAEQVRDLNVGDVVEVTDTEHPTVKATGELREGVGGSLFLGTFLLVRYTDGTPQAGITRELRVVKRAEPPRPPLYTNSPRTEPLQGDVVRLPGKRPHWADNLTWFYNGEQWYSLNRSDPGPIIGDMPRPVVLLVDGSTGLAVQ